MVVRPVKPLEVLYLPLISTLTSMSVFHDVMIQQQRKEGGKLRHTNKQ